MIKKFNVVMFTAGIFSVFTCAISGFAGTKTLQAPSSIIYDNGPIATGAISENNTAAPAGTQWSELQHNAGNTAEANTGTGILCAVILPNTINRCADDFSVPVGQTWTINQVITFAHVTNFSGTASPFIAANLQIWRGRPGDPGSTIVFGDTTTNRLASSTDSLIYRISNSSVPATINPVTNRRVWQNNLAVSPAAVLTAGTYWIDFQTDSGGTSNFTPQTTIRLTRTTPLMNARIFSSSNATWDNVTDIGLPVIAPDVNLDFPFKLDGTITGAPLASTSRKVDFDGDNKADFAIARSASATTASTWWIQNSGGSSAVFPWGLGVGYASGDRATPEDFDGDGKTDVAIWRPGTNALFYILRSSNSTVMIQQFGQTGDDVSVVDDYDGDGKADPAVFRSGAQGFFYYRGSLNNPSGNITYVPFGTTGDVAVPGDYDGDGRADFSIMRNTGGLAVFYQQRTTAGFRTVFFGLSTDKFAPGDYDGDGRTDICVVRSGSAFTWYLLKSSSDVLVQYDFGSPATDFITQADYDGDNKTDFAVWRSGTGADRGFFFVTNSSSSPMGVKWGDSAVALTASDYPVANYNVR